LIREQAFGESLDPHRLDKLARYEVHLDRKLERSRHAAQTSGSEAGRHARRGSLIRFVKWSSRE
jgi:hypothetical protein